MTAPKTQKDKASKRKKVLLTVLIVVVVVGILTTAGYFSELLFLFLSFILKGHTHNLKDANQAFPL